MTQHTCEMCDGKGIICRKCGRNHGRVFANRCDECSTPPPDRTARLVAALRGLVSAVSAQLARGEDTTPGDFERAWREACATLAEFEPESAHALSCNARRRGAACNCALGRVTP